MRNSLARAGRLLSRRLACVEVTALQSDLLHVALRPASVLDIQHASMRWLYCCDRCPGAAACLCKGTC